MSDLSQIEKGYWICAAYQHVKNFGADVVNIDEFHVTLLAGKTAHFLNAIRGRQVIGNDDLKRAAKAQRISSYELSSQIIPSLDQLKLERVAVRRTAQGLTIEEYLNTIAQLYEVIAALWESMDPTLIERGAIHILRHTYEMPQLETDLCDLLTHDGLVDEQATAAVGVTSSFRIVQKYEGSGLDEPVVFNSYVWRNNHNKIAQVLVRLPEDERATVQQCITTVSQYQAFPIEQLDLEPELLTTAHSIGLIDLMKVNTAADDSKEFVFTPHLTTHPDVSLIADDLLNDVRAVLACVAYGENYSAISRLGGADRDKTIFTLEKLLREGEAGDATAIGVDYTLLEERGIITTEPTKTWPGGRYKMVLQRREPIEIALNAIRDSISSEKRRPLLINSKSGDPGSLLAIPEQMRIANSAKLGDQPEHVKEARNYFVKSIRKEVFK